MEKRRKNTVDFVEEVDVPEERVISLADAKVQFLRDIRGLAKTHRVVSEGAFCILHARRARTEGKHHQWADSVGSGAHSIPA